MGHLRLVRSARAGEVGRSTVDGVQVTLFPDPHTIVLVRMNDERGANLPDLLQKWRPRLVADFRSMPRFDFGLLSRSRIFCTFEELAIRYYDLGGAAADSSIATNEQLFRAFRTILANTAEGPMVLLLEPNADTEKTFSALGRNPENQESRWSVLVQ